jgi:hypothetical protein
MAQRNPGGSLKVKRLSQGLVAQAVPPSITTPLICDPATDLTKSTLSSLPRVPHYTGAHGQISLSR